MAKARITVVEVPVPDGVVFVRSYTKQELDEEFGGEALEAYKVMNWKEECVVITIGSAAEAFNAAWEAGYTAVWMH